jgi:hypothetical protein
MHLRYVTQSGNTKLCYVALTGHMRDSYLALAYAAEQLFLAAQELSSDTIPADIAVERTCTRLLPNVLQHAKWLPMRLQSELRRLEQLCTTFNQRRSLDAVVLKSAISDLLSRVNERLRPQDVPPLAS